MIGDKAHAQRGEGRVGKGGGQSRVLRTRLGKIAGWSVWRRKRRRGGGQGELQKRRGEEEEEEGEDLQRQVGLKDPLASTLHMGPVNTRDAAMIYWVPDLLAKTSPLAGCGPHQIMNRQASICQTVGMWSCPCALANSLESGYVLRRGATGCSI